MYILVLCIVSYNHNNFSPKKGGDKMKNKKYYTIGTVPKSNLKII